MAEGESLSYGIANRVDLPFQLGEKVSAISFGWGRRLLRRERGDDFFEARIAAKRLPDDREEFKGAVAQHQ